MQVITFKAKPSMIFGLALALVGALVIVITFVSNHSANAKQTLSQNVSCSSSAERLSYLTSLGWEGKNESEKEIIIPKDFNEVYTNYNSLQKEQGFDLEKYKGKSVKLYTYNIKNYKDNKNVIADLLVYDNTLIGADLCDPSAKDGFLVALKPWKDLTN